MGSFLLTETLADSHLNQKLSRILNVPDCAMKKCTVYKIISGIFYMLPYRALGLEISLSLGINDIQHTQCVLSSQCGNMFFLTLKLLKTNPLRRKQVQQVDKSPKCSCQLQ